MLKKNIKAFVVYIISWIGLISIYLAKKAQIGLLIIKKITISNEYLDFSNVCSEEKILILSELNKLNQHFIKLQNNKHLFYRPIYSLKLIEFKILKTYIIINLAKSFIQLSKLFASTFMQKSDCNFWLYLTHWYLNNLIIKN